MQRPKRTNFAWPRTPSNHRLGKDFSPMHDLRQLHNQPGGLDNHKKGERSEQNVTSRSLLPPGTSSKCSPNKMNNSVESRASKKRTPAAKMFQSGTREHARTGSNTRERDHLNVTWSSQCSESLSWFSFPLPAQPDARELRNAPTQ